MIASEILNYYGEGKEERRLMASLRHLQQDPDVGDHGAAFTARAIAPP